jgi:N6-adenosine-specific RNA methylase IME4
MTPLQNHPAADAFPMMESTRFDELKADIQAQGQLEPITVCDGMILDGRNRYKACTELGIEPLLRNYDGDPWAYAWSLNGERRDLVAEQRYLIWAKCSENSEVWKAKKKQIKAEADQKRSEAAKGNDNASKKREDKTVVQQSVAQPFPQPEERRHKSTPTKATASKTNAGAVARGDQLRKQRPDLAEKVMLGEIKPAEAHRQMKKDQVAGKVAELPADKFNVIYADPPWAYNDKQGGAISESYGGAEKHYPSMTMTELKALDVPAMAADNCVLWLWATCPLLEDALDLCKAWGFKYKAQFVWDKVKHNMGHYNSVRHELLLVCTRGSATPENVKLFDSVQSIERTEHSRKPEEFRDIINTLYPSGKKIELFRRGDAPEGWQTWGNEA